MKLNVKLISGEPKCEYSVQFECISTFHAYFEGKAGLTDEEIVQRGLMIAEGTFGHGGNLVVERMSKAGSYAFTAVGIDKHTARILGKPIGDEKPTKLRLVK